MSPISYFINGSHALVDQLQSYIATPCLAVMKKSTENSSEFEVVYIDDCKKCSYSNVDWANIPPLSESIILEYSHVEHEYLKMADRLGVMLPYQKRKDDFDRHLRFWHWKLSQFEISHAIFENIPHEGYNFVIYHILSRFNVHIISFFQLPIRPKKTYLLQAVFDLYDHGTQLRKLLSNNNRDTQPRLLDSEIKKKFSGYFDVMNLEPSSVQSFTRVNTQSINKTSGYSPLQSIYFVAHKVVSKIVRKISILNKHSLSELYKVVGVKLRLDSYFYSHKVLSNYYNHHSDAPSLNIPYIYFPLHFQPELSTSPLGGVFVNQHLAVEIVAYAAQKQGISVYVKEHPRGSKALGTRSFDFYQKLLKYDNLVLVSDKVNTYDLVDNSICVATITGGAGWEALLRKKPVLMFGSRFYEAFVGTFSVRSSNCVIKALDVIMNSDFLIDDHQIMTFLRALDQVTIEAFNSNQDESIATVSYSQSISNKAKMIADNFINDEIT